MPKMQRSITILAAIAFCVTGGCATPPPEKLPSRLIGQTPGAIGSGDVIRLTFPGAPEFNVLQKVRADGKISLPLLGEMPVAGMQVGELQLLLAERYQSQLKDKNVIVSLEASSLAVYVSGAVNKPGKVQLDRPMTVLEAIMEAGGFAQGRANAKKVVVVRGEKGHQYTEVLDLRPALRGQSTNSFNVRAYDVIYIPESFF